MPYDLSRKIAFVTEQHGAALMRRARTCDAAALESKEIHDAAAFVAHVARHDPSPNGAYVLWLARAYLAQWDGCRLEDLGRARTALTRLLAVRNRLPANERDLYRHKTLSELEYAAERCCRSLNADDSVREEMRRERDAARAESVILCERLELPDGDVMTAAVPLTERSAKWWGQGTRWCTSARNENKFADYHERCPLVVVVLWSSRDEDSGMGESLGTAEDAPGVKLVLYPGGRGAFANFMDASDVPVCPQFMERHWTALGPLLRWAVQVNGFSMRLVPEHLRDRAMCLCAVRNDGCLLHDVPDVELDEEMLLAGSEEAGAEATWEGKLHALRDALRLDVEPELQLAHESLAPTR